MLLKANKPVLTKAILDFVEKNKPQIVSNIHKTGHFVLDGGSLLHKVEWEKIRHKTIASSYVNYVITNFDKETVVFDSYPDLPSIKDNVHTGRIILLRLPSQMICCFIQRDLFLGNNINKQKFINLLSI